MQVVSSVLAVCTSKSPADIAVLQTDNFQHIQPKLSFYTISKINTYINQILSRLASNNLWTIKNLKLHYLLNHSYDFAYFEKKKIILQKI